jgi:phosphoenolpyruvate synthase/pyruvate phosphate dikinase
MDILAYPRDFVPKPADMWVTPNEAYYLRIKAGGIEKEIRWNGETLSTEPQAAALREWFKKLQDLVYETPEYKALPPMRGGYA